MSNNTLQHTLNYTQGWTDIEENLNSACAQLQTALMTIKKLKQTMIIHASSDGAASSEQVPERMTHIPVARPVARPVIVPTINSEDRPADMNAAEILVSMSNGISYVLPDVDTESDSDVDETERPTSLGSSGGNASENECASGTCCNLSPNAAAYPQMQGSSEDKLGVFKGCNRQSFLATRSSAMPCDRSSNVCPPGPAFRPRSSVGSDKGCQAQGGKKDDRTQRGTQDDRTRGGPKRRDYSATRLSDVGMRARVMWVPASCTKKKVQVSDLMPYFGTVVQHTPGGLFTHKILYDDGTLKWHHYPQEKELLTLIENSPG